jgi:flavodoxin
MDRTMNTEDVARAITKSLEEAHKCPVEVYTDIEPDEEGNAVFSVIVDSHPKVSFFEVRVKFLQDA